MSALTIASHQTGSYLGEAGKAYIMEGVVGESGGVADAFITSLAMILVTEVSTVSRAAQSVQGKRPKLVVLKVGP